VKIIIKEFMVWRKEDGEIIHQRDQGKGKMGL
jgi:hypothetical protein